LHFVASACRSDGHSDARHLADILAHFACLHAKSLLNCRGGSRARVSSFLTCGTAALGCEDRRPRWSRISCHNTRSPSGGEITAHH
jgi:hypothetical protein